MRNSPQVALLVSTYQRPEHLRLCLMSIARQQGVDNQFEVVVCDDGSADSTFKVVAQFASQVPFPVRMTTHRHHGFRLASCRNDGVLVSSAPYLLFLDGDCVLPHDHVHHHLQRRKPETVIAGDCCRLTHAATQEMTAQDICDNRMSQYASASELKRLSRQHSKAALYHLMRHPTKPKLVGNNIGIWRSDYESINGYDEQFRGWGCEDDDLRIRLRRSRLRIESILDQTHTYHLWHPFVATRPRRWRDGQNVSYVRGSVRRAVRCQFGMRRVNETASEDRIQRRTHFAELLFTPVHQSFSQHADVRIITTCERESLTFQFDGPQPHVVRHLDAIGDLPAEFFQETGELRPEYSKLNTAEHTFDQEPLVDVCGRSAA